jgi:hypothetical protein
MAMTVPVRTALQPIETPYRGYRFRSQPEARWAVFFDAAGIKWSYEDQSYKLNGRGYLPDFWLPQLETFVETKSDDEACKQALPMLRALVAATGHQEKTWIAREFWEQCPFCSSIHLGGFYSDLCNRVPCLAPLRRLAQLRKRGRYDLCCCVVACYEVNRPRRGPIPDAAGGIVE